jgi:hypothetical protein
MNDNSNKYTSDSITLLLCSSSNACTLGYCQMRYHNHYNNEIVKIQVEEALAYFNIFFQHSSRNSVENDKKTQDIRYPDQDTSNIPYIRCVNN